MGLSAISSSGQYAPFWLTANTHGNISHSPHSGNLRLGIYKPGTCPTRWFDYDFALSMSGRLSSRLPGEPRTTHASAYTDLCYAHARLYIVDITAGVKPMVFGGADPELSSGGLLFSANARPMPRITIGLDHWTPLPGLYGYLEVRGGLTYAWQYDQIELTRVHMQHKFIGGRIGGRLPVNLSYEFHHAAQWGGYSPIYGDLGNNWHSFWNSFKAQAGGSMANDQLNAQGNHIGSQILQLDIKWSDWQISAYWHNLFEDGPIRMIGLSMNAADGLWGINIQQKKWPYIQSLTFELVNTTDQSGPFHDKDGYIYGGADSYYRNSIYTNGWNYHMMTIGTPFITSPCYNQDGSTMTQNNRVTAYYGGIRGDIYGFQYRLIASHVNNYGYNARSRVRQSQNTALLLQVSKHVEQAWGLDFGLSLATDIGTQFGHSFGAQITISKQGILSKWIRK